VSLGSLLLYLTFFVETVVLGELGIYGVTREILIEMYIIVFLLTVMAYWKHRGNISRLIHGNERKTYLSHKNQEKAKEDNK
jgi:glycerol-3-phosphate acyltransferase PlsY